MDTARSTRIDYENQCKLLLKKPHGKRPLEVLRCVWTNSINIGLREVGHEDVDWMQVA
jgi:hypothetical protein